MTELKPELKAQIWEEAKAYAKSFGRKEIGYYSLNYQAGATAYALKIQQAEERIKQLEQWKKEAKLILDPLLDWGQEQKDIPLGKDVTVEILRRAKLYTEAEEMMERMEREIQNAWESRVNGQMTEHSSIRLIEIVRLYNHYKKAKQ